MNTPIRAGWTICAIGSVASYIQRGKSPKYADRSALPVINQKSIRWHGLESQHFKYIHPDHISSWDEARYIKRGDVLWNSTGTGTVGRACLIKDNDVLAPKVVDSHVTIVRPGSHVDARYLFYWIKGPDVQQKVADMCDGSTNQIELNRAAISATNIPLAPLAEQKRIADKLDTVLVRVDACRERLDRVPTMLKRFRQSVLAAATSGRLTEDWRSNQRCSEGGANELLRNVQVAKKQWVVSNKTHNESARVLKRATSAGSRVNASTGLPDQWQWSALEDAVLMVVDCHNKTAPYVPSGIPLVRTSNIREQSIVWADMKYVSEETYAYWSKRCSPEPGDLIYTREAPMGEVMVIPPEMRLCLGQRTMLFRPLESFISSQYLLYAVSDPHFKSRSEMVAVGSGVKHLRVGDVSELLLPIPPKQEQDEITRRVERLFAFADSLEARIHCARTSAERLIPAILAKAFRGELVPQDLDDEPAAEMLERLAEQQEESVAITKRKGSKGARQLMPSEAEDSFAE